MLCSAIRHLFVSLSCTSNCSLIRNTHSSLEVGHSNLRGGREEGREGGREGRRGGREGGRERVSE